MSGDTDAFNLAPNEKAKDELRKSALGVTKSMVTQKS